MYSVMFATFNALRLRMHINDAMLIRSTICNHWDNQHRLTGPGRRVASYTCGNELGLMKAICVFQRMLLTVISRYKMLSC